MLIKNDFIPSALDLSFEEWQQWCAEQRLPKFVGRQIGEWIYRKGVLDPSAFTNIELAVRKSLSQSFNWELMEIDSQLISQDGSEKFLLKTADDLLIEMVLMPHPSRTTLCISCQVGCKMGCTFCQTGKMGFKRNLRASEIVAQLLIANRTLAAREGGSKVTNVVFMGMGEPLDNYEEVVKACSLMIAPMGFALSKSRVTISTAGLIPAIKRLGGDLPVRLAISLHSADDELRSKMMPINRTYNLKELKEALLEYPAPSRYGITFEYVMIEGVNDHLKDAKKLVSFLHGLKAKVNLIPVNHFPGMQMRASGSERLNQFQAYLSSRGIPAPIRYSRGQDISGGCGQLAAKRKEEIDSDPRQLRRHRLRMSL
jgi:23S rRNA (adenine2503-C2)-methyltransferase